MWSLFIISVCIGTREERGKPTVDVQAAIIRVFFFTNHNQIDNNSRIFSSLVVFPIEGKGKGKGERRGKLMLNYDVFARLS